MVRVRVRVRLRVRVQRPWPHDAREHTGDAVVLEEDVAGEELGEDGAEGPEVDLLVVRQAEDDLGRAVGARLQARRQGGEGVGEGGGEGGGEGVVKKGWRDEYVAQDLHVRGEVVAREARGAEVDDLDLAARVGLDEDVLRLEVAVDQVEACKVEVG